MDARGPAELLRDGALRVVVAAGEDDADAFGGEPRDLAREPDPGLVVAPVAVEEVAGEEEHGGFLGEAELDEVPERLPRGAAEDLRRALVAAELEPVERRVEVHVRRVDDLQGGHQASPPVLPAPPDTLLPPGDTLLDIWGTTLFFPITRSQATGGARLEK